MHQDTSKPKKVINVTRVTISSPHSSRSSPHASLGRTTGENWGELSGENLIEKCRELIADGWTLRVKRRKTTLYISARKTINGKRKEIYVSKVKPEEIEELKKLGLLSATSREKKPKTTSRVKKTTTTNTTTRQQPQPPARQPSHGGVGGHERARHGEVEQQGGLRRCVFMVHRLGLRFVKPWVSPLLLQGLGRARYIERSKQWILKLEVGVKRLLTLQVNNDGTAQVFLEASDNPLGVDEFIGFCKFMLLEVFRRATGKQVSLSDFEVMVAPEINCDLDGVKLMEGVKSLTLQDYYEDVVRIYYSEPGVKESMPNGGTRVEVRASSLNGYSLEEVVDGVVSMAKLPAVLTEIKKDLELIKGSLPRQQLEYSQLSEAVATKLANLIYVTFEKWGNRFELALRELGSKLQEVLKPVFDKIERLERENQELKRKLQELTSEDSSFKFEDLPSSLKDFLKEMERDGYIRLSDTRISYGDRVWAAIIKRKGNIDGWLNEASYDYFGKEDNRELFKAVIKAIRFYDNKFNGKPGVPYDKFLEALEKFLGSEVTPVTEGYTHNQKEEKKKTKQLTLFMRASELEEGKQKPRCCPYLLYGMCSVAPPGVDPRTVYNKERCCGLYESCNYYKRAKLNTS